MAIYLGMISGTSADGIDAVLLNTADKSQTAKVIGHHHSPYSESVASEVKSLFTPGENEIDRLGALDIKLGKLFAETALTLIKQSKIAPEDVAAIGSHGQTIRHRPRSQAQTPFTLQIGDPNTIAELTGIVTVADFRRRDMAAEGEGAPLVPAFHRAVFASAEEQRIILNIGGIANLTDLASGIAYDIGPGNGLMDAWCSRHLSTPYDDQGQWALSGRIVPDLLQRLLSHPYLLRKPPKSTGKEEFHSEWLDSILTSLTAVPRPQDVQATLLELTAQTIISATESLSKNAHIYACGGGVKNTALMNRLQTLSTNTLNTTAKLGIPPQQVEAAAFAWLASRTLAGETGNCPTATGAKGERVLGAIYHR